MFGLINTDDLFELPIGNELDLHTFQPRDVKSLVPEYIRECLHKNIFEVRIIHGKGQGHLRRMVHATLDRIPAVLSYKLAGEGRGSWGATIVFLDDTLMDPSEE
ncbi:MAG: Smr/MutS family protein [FCB group bacterium]|nr:Smr/MutS family protein [FCB group bacterium]